MSKVKFIEECNYLLEANCFLLRYFSNQTFEQLKSEIDSELSIKDNIKLISLMDDIYQETLSRVSINKSVAKYYKLFDEEDTFNHYLAINMLMFAIKDDISDFTNVGKHIKKSFRENKLEFISLLLAMDNLDELELTDGTFNKLLEQANIQEELKWSVLQVYNHFDDHLDILLEELEKIAIVLKEIYQKHQDKQQEFIDYWKLKCQNIDDFQEAINIHVSLKIDPRDTIIVRATWMGLNALVIYVFDKWEYEYLYIGLLFQDKSLLSHGISTEMLSEILKLFADKSKLEILKLVKIKGYYGAELADKLKLTTATISYHMNALTNANLVGITKEANKIYYHLNEPFIQKVINQLESNLLN